MSALPGGPLLRGCQAGRQLAGAAGFSSRPGARQHPPAGTPPARCPVKPAAPGRAGLTRPRAAAASSSGSVAVREERAAQKEGEPLLDDSDAAAARSTAVRDIRQAVRQGQLGFGFSAGGLLFPFYIGVLDELRTLSIVTEGTNLAGASAGSLIAACHHAGLSAPLVLQACFQLSADCRAKGTRGRLGIVLKDFLMDLLPPDAHERCSGRTHVAVTQAWPGLQGRLVSDFATRDDLIACLLTSCHIPYWFDTSLARQFRGAWHFDGGLTNFLPVPPCGYPIRVSCFPGRALSQRISVPISICPPGSLYSFQQLISWAFAPAEDDVLRGLVEQGRLAAFTWAQDSGALAAQQDPEGERRPPEAAGAEPSRSAVSL